MIAAEIAIWHWVGANCLAILIGLYFAILACTLLLAFLIRNLTVRIDASIRESAHQRVSLDRLTSYMHEIALRASAAAAAAPGQRSDRGEAMQLPAVRDEIAALQAELHSDAPDDETPQSPAADVRAEARKDCHQEPEAHKELRHA